MFVVTTFRNLLYSIKKKDEHKEPQPKKHDLFQKDGWGPKQPAESIKPHKYRGPSYPLPMRPKLFETSEESIRLCNAARKFWSLNELEKAACSYLKAAKKAPANPDFLFELAHLRWSQNRVEEAKDLLEKALKINPNWYPLLVSLFLLHLARHDQYAVDVFCGKLIGCKPHAPFDIECAVSWRAYKELF
jgi:tetratricopeptide (TPR) repeat protein